MSDYEHILISAVRYALGRMTYIVSLTVDYIIKEINDNKISKYALTIMLKDILEKDNLGMECDQKEWYKLIDKIKSILNN